MIYNETVINYENKPILTTLFHIKFIYITVFDRRFS